MIFKNLVHDRAVKYERMAVTASVVTDRDGTCFVGSVRICGSNVHAASRPSRPVAEFARNVNVVLLTDRS
jgi:hypothetical protein